MTPPPVSFLPSAPQRALLVLGAALTLLACSDRSANRKPTDDVKLVGASGSFGTTRGELVVAVSPRDEAGNFVGEDLDQDAFAFEAVTIAPAGRPAQAIDVDMRVTEIEVHKPAAGEALVGVVVFDSSGSMSGNDGNFAGRRAGGNAVFDLLGKDDELAVIHFGASKVDPGLSASQVLQDFTSDPELLRASLQSLQNNGGTPLYESLLDALKLLDEHHGKGGSVIVLTDGNASNAKLPQVIEKALAQDVQIYAIGLGTTLDFPDLARLAQETSGAFASAREAALLQAVFDGVGTGVRSGRVTVRGEGSYMTLPSSTGQLYDVSGELVTNDPLGDAIRTPFKFVTKLSN